MPGEPFLIPDTNSNVNRPIGPVAKPNAYETWSTRMWWRQATCEEVGCEQRAKGWVTAIDETTIQGRERADYIRYHSGRVFRTTRTEQGWTAFEFPPGQTCFATADSTHRVQADQPALFVAQPGDWRGAAGRARVYDRGDQFADDLHSHTDQIATARSRAGTAGN